MRFGNQPFIEGAVSIGFSVGAFNPFDEIKKVFQGLHGKRGRNGLVGMNGHVAELDDPFDFLEQKVGELFFEGVFVDERGKRILVGSLYALIDGINPFYGELQSLAAADDAHGGRRGKDLFRFYGGSGEHGELFAVVQKVEVGHTGTPILNILINYPLIINYLKLSS